MPNFNKYLSRPAALALAAGLAAGLFTSSAALAGPFSEFKGSWSGSGTIRPQGGDAERIRCHASYKPNGSSDRQLDAHLRCASDSYNFDLSGQFVADERNGISGQWTENTRNIGGNALGNIRTNRMQVRVESPGFSADLLLTMHGHRQSVEIDSFGGGQITKATISLTRS